LRILFVGNSLLNNNDVPGAVAAMLKSDGSKREVSYRAFFVPHLEDVVAGGEIDKEIASGRYDVVILQAAMVSSSRTITYSQTRGIAMAKAAKAHGSRVLLYVEWPRRGIDETEYTINVYRGIAKAAGSELLPVCYAWNAVHAKLPHFELWMPDGNHASAGGSFIAAACVYFRISGVGRTPTFKPHSVGGSFAQVALKQCRDLEKRLPAKSQYGDAS
jgi:hypothetical protein